MLNENITSWVLPEDYTNMSSKDQSETLKTCILRFLKSNGPNTASKITKEINAPNITTIKKMLTQLTATRQIYSETYGDRTTIYFPNGSLAHPLLQGNVRCGLNTEYMIRTYLDRVYGKYITITEYQISYDGKKKPIGGIRIDLIDVEEIISELIRIYNISVDSEVVDRGLITATR